MPKLTVHSQTPSSLQQVSELLLEHSAAIRAMADTMTTQKIESLEVSHYDQLMRGLEYLDNFSGAVRGSIRAMRFSRGDFAGPETSGNKKSATATKVVRKSVHQ